MAFPTTLRPESKVAVAVIALTMMLWQSTCTNANAQAPKQLKQDKPFVVEYYYKTMWGSAGEFISLFKKNHYPYLKKKMELGHILQVTAESPIYHSTETDRWDYRVRIVWKNVQVANDDSEDDRILKQLFPDQESFKREEQRRFQVLLAHWDVPIKTVSLEDK